MNETIRTYDKIASRYANFRWDTTEKWRIPPYRHFLRYCKGNEVLDVGCGPGRDAAYFRSKGLIVTGVDASAGILAEAMKRVPGVTFMKSDMRNLRLRQKFDGIWCCASLIHLRKSEVPNVLDSFAKLLYRNGILYIAVKQGDGEGLKRYPDGTRRFFSYYKKAEISNLVSSKFRLLRKVVVSRKDDHGDRWIEVFATPKVNKQ